MRAVTKILNFVLIVKLHGTAFESSELLIKEDLIVFARVFESLIDRSIDRFLASSPAQLVADCEIVKSYGLARMTLSHFMSCKIDQYIAPS